MNGRLAARLIILVGGVTLLSWIAAPSPVQAANVGYYLKGDGVPEASMSTSGNTGTGAPNYDAGRNEDPGLTLKKGGSLSTTDGSRYQEWSADGAIAINGSVTLKISTAVKHFKTDKGGRITAYLLDCDGSGSGCTVVDSASLTKNPWAATGDWEPISLTIGGVDHQFDTGRTMVLRLVVDNTSEDDLMFAYGTNTFQSRLVVNETTPTSTTTSSSTTTSTTSTVPGSSTTTSTTSTVPGSSTTTTSTTSTVPGSSTTTTSTTSTTVAPGESTTTTSTTTTLPPDSSTTSTTSTTVVPAPPTTSGETPPVTATSIPPPAGDETTKEQMVIQSQQEPHVPVSAEETRRLSPQQGLTVTFSTAVETLRSQVLEGVGLGILAAWLGLAGLERRRSRQSSRRGDLAPSKS